MSLRFISSSSFCMLSSICFVFSISFWSASFRSLDCCEPKTIFFNCLARSCKRFVYYSKSINIKSFQLVLMTTFTALRSYIWRRDFMY
jgi:hypothetical protein